MINKFIGIGNLCQDPKIQQLQDKQKCSFSLAINSTKTEVIFLNIECWNNVAENCNKYLNKGSCVYVEGKIKNSKWKDKDGNNRNNFFISADIVRFLPNGRKQEPENEQEKLVEKDTTPRSIPNIVEEDDMPF
jgi:single-strand DNA-binding protein